MLQIDAQTVNAALTHPELIDALALAFQDDVAVPPRMHYDVNNPNASRETTLLMMPAWQSGDVIGVKLVTVAPENATKNIPSIQGSYLLFDVDTGSLKAIMDAPAITAKRTAAASALASRFLSREDSETLLVVGTGTLAPELITAHLSVRPIKRVIVWGRNKQKAAELCTELSDLPVSFELADRIEDAISKADIISCATLSKEPLIFGELLKPGQHLDMVGAYRPDMREMDNDCVKRGKIFVDNREMACKETGDLVIPLATGVITKDNVIADLFALSRNEYQLTRADEDITIFKSVGHALEDLAAAKVVYEHAINNGN